MEQLSIIKELLIHNKIQFTIHDKLELLHQSTYPTFFDRLLRRKYYNNFADIKTDETTNSFIITVYDDKYFEFCQKLAIKISEFTDVKVLYCGPIVYYLRLDKTRRNSAFYLHNVNYARKIS